MSRKYRHFPKERNGEMQLHCKDCDTWKPVADFYQYGHCLDGRPKYKPYCKKCSSIRNNAWKKANYVPKQTRDPERFIACRLCQYPVHACEAENGVCPLCRALEMAEAWKMEWHRLSQNHPGHEDRMASHIKRAALELPLFAPRLNVRGETYVLC